MSLPLRAYLALKFGAGDWSVQVARDFESVLAAWRNRGDDAVTGVLHIGFDRPASSAFEDVSANFPGRVLLTSAAKYGLPHGYEATDAVIGVVEGIPVHLGTVGWGYLLDESTIASVENARRSVDARAASGWVIRYFEQFPGRRNALVDAQIFDDDSYLANESALPHTERVAAARFRFDEIVGNDVNDPTAIARAAPPWLLDRGFGTMDLSVRLGNVFADRGIVRVSDLAKLREFDLYRFRNLGTKSIRLLRGILMDAFDEGPGTLTRSWRKPSPAP